MIFPLIFIGFACFLSQITAPPVLQGASVLGYSYVLQPMAYMYFKDGSIAPVMKVLRFGASIQVFGFPSVLNQPPVLLFDSIFSQATFYPPAVVSSSAPSTVATPPSTPTPQGFVHVFPVYASAYMLLEDGVHVAIQKVIQTEHDDVQVFGHPLVHGQGEQPLIYNSNDSRTYGPMTTDMINYFLSCVWGTPFHGRMPWTSAHSFDLTEAIQFAPAPVNDDDVPAVTAPAPVYGNDVAEIVSVSPQGPETADDVVADEVIPVQDGPLRETVSSKLEPIPEEIESEEHEQKVTVKIDETSETSFDSSMDLPTLTDSTEYSESTTLSDSAVAPLVPPPFKSTIKKLREKKIKVVAADTEENRPTLKAKPAVKVSSKRAQREAATKQKVLEAGERFKEEALRRRVSSLVQEMFDRVRRNNPDPSSPLPVATEPIVSEDPSETLETANDSQLSKIPEPLSESKQTPETIEPAEELPVSENSELSPSTVEQEKSQSFQRVVETSGSGLTRAVALPETLGPDVAEREDMALQNLVRNLKEVFGHEAKPVSRAYMEKVDAHAFAFKMELERHNVEVDAQVVRVAAAEFSSLESEHRGDEKYLKLLTNVFLFKIVEESFQAKFHLLKGYWISTVNEIYAKSMVNELQGTKVVKKLPKGWSLTRKELISYRAQFNPFWRQLDNLSFLEQYLRENSDGTIEDYETLSANYDKTKLPKFGTTLPAISSAVEAFGIWSKAIQVFRNI